MDVITDTSFGVNSEGRPFFNFSTMNGLSVELDPSPEDFEKLVKIKSGAQCNVYISRKQNNKGRLITSLVIDDLEILNVKRFEESSRYAIDYPIFERAEHDWRGINWDNVQALSQHIPVLPKKGVHIGEGYEDVLISPSPQKLLKGGLVDFGNGKKGILLNDVQVGDRTIRITTGGNLGIKITGAPEAELTLPEQIIHIRDKDVEVDKNRLDKKKRKFKFNE